MQVITPDILTAAKIAAKDSTRPEIAAVCVTKERIIATDSFKVVIIDRKGDSSTEDYPIIEGIKQVKEIEKPLLIPAQALLKKMKFVKNKALPILSNAVLCNETANHISLMTTELHTSTIQMFPKIEGEYPNIDHVIPTSPAKATIKLDANLLVELLEAFTGSVGHIEIEVRESNEPIKIVGTSMSNENKIGLLMPIRS